MKKLLLLLLAFPLFVACSSSDDDKGEDIEYLDNSLVEGKWYWIDASDSTVMIFNKNNCISHRYEKYIGSLDGVFEHGSYKITATEIFYTYPRGASQQYKLRGDTLSLLNKTIWINYIKVK